MLDYWIFNSRNALKGFYDVNGLPDVDNPPVLTDDVIAYALRTSRKARDEFNLLYPNLLPEEQARLDALINQNPHMTALMQDPQTMEDAFQSTWNRAPVRTTGPRGGRGWGGSR